MWLHQIFYSMANILQSFSFSFCSWKRDPSICEGSQLLSVLYAYVKGSFAGRALFVSLRMSSHSWGKNSSWCTGWESQQQGRKLRPGSQISSVSAAAAAPVWPDALTGPMFASLAARASAIRICTSQGHSCAHRAASKRYLRVAPSASGQQGGFSAVLKAWWLLLSALCFIWKPSHDPAGLHYSAWVLLATCIPSNYNIWKRHRHSRLSVGQRHAYLFPAFKTKHTVESCVHLKL